jgi:signal transduction histidine kinase
MWTLHDVTQERDALDQRQRLLELERRAREAAQTQIEELAELDGLRRRLVSTVSHELRTPLTAILSYLQLVLDDPAGRLDAEDAAALETAHRNAQRLRRLVDDLLEVQRLDQGKAVLLLGEVDVAALVREEVATIEPTAAEHGIELRAEVDPVPALEADDGRLRQVVDNILDNAIHYTAAGGRVTARVAREDDSVRIEIEDTGIGIAPADVPHVFEPFFRAPGADGHRPTGSGLGLAIARGIVEAHGGTIECASVPGRGTTFSLRLPSHPSRSTP